MYYLRDFKNAEPNFFSDSVEFRSLEKVKPTFILFDKEETELKVSSQKNYWVLLKKLTPQKIMSIDSNKIIALFYKCSSSFGLN